MVVGNWMGVYFGGWVVYLGSGSLFGLTLYYVLCIVIYSQGGGVVVFLGGFCIFGRWGPFGCW